MRLSYNQLNQILEDFPNFELSYEKKLHKKVQSDIYLTIPKGKSILLGLNYIKIILCVFFLKLIEVINQLKIYFNFQFPFKKELCSGVGTILYGTIFFVNKKRCFNIENIYYLMGNNLKFSNNAQKIKEMYNLMKLY